MRLGFALIGLALFSACWAADDTILKLDGYDVVVPANSPVKLAPQPDKESDAIASFDGQLTLTGEYTYGWDSFDEDGMDWLTLSFTPDKAVVGRLPHMKDRPADFFEFVNEDDFITAAIPSQTLKLLKDKKVKSVNGRITIVADHFTIAHIPCDTTGYLIRFISVQHPAVAKLSRKFGGSSAGCG